MLTTGIKAKLIAFVAVALLATAYLGARYVGIDFTRSSYSVTVSMPDAAGSFENGEVTYRGVPVGRIASLEATPQGARATLRIDGATAEYWESPGKVAVAVQMAKGLVSDDKPDLGDNDTVQL